MPRSASACICWSEPHLIFPASGGEYHPAHPLLAYGVSADSFELVDESGGTIGLEVTLAADVWGGCSGTVYQLRTLAGLGPGQRYELASARAESTSERGSLVASATDPTYRALARVDVTAMLEELPPDQVGPALCGDAKLGGRPIAATLVIEVRTRPDAPVILTARVEDPVSGMLESADVSLSRERARRDLARIDFSLPAEANRCADVGVLDLNGVDMFRETLCPGVSAPVWRSFEAELVVLPATTTETRDVAPPSGCSIARPSRSRSSLLAWLAATVIILQGSRWRRRKARESAQSVARCRSSHRASDE